jgi:hypothetical protein
MSGIESIFFGLGGVADIGQRGPREVRTAILTWAEKEVPRPPVEALCKCTERWNVRSVAFSKGGTVIEYSCPSCGESTEAEIGAT